MILPSTYIQFLPIQKGFFKNEMISENAATNLFISRRVYKTFTVSRTYFHFTRVNQFPCCMQNNFLLFSYIYQYAGILGECDIW